MKGKFVLLLALIGLTASARDSRQEIRLTPEKAGGVYYAYPGPQADSLFTVPGGYKPFYISHYGRHGSRYLISDRDYLRVLERLNHADSLGALTPLGRDVLDRVRLVWDEARGRGGELTPLGARQHRGIARRMGLAYPEVFADSLARITAASTTVMRCAHSMFAFVEGLKELYPYLNIPRESGARNMYYLNYHSPESGPYSSENGPWYEPYKAFKADKTRPDRLVASIFADPEYVRQHVSPSDFMWDIYWLAVDMQNMETPVSFMDLLTNDEIYNLWEVFNFNFYSCNSSYPPAEGHFTANASNLVRNILTESDRYIGDEGAHGTTLRFGHDGNIIPLTALMRLEGCYSDVTDPYALAADYADYSISPMASNLQLIFLRNETDPSDVIVKITLNEHDITVDGVAPDATGPYYRWPTLRKHLSEIINPD